MKTGITLLIALLVIVFHIWASRRRPKYWYLGGIMPLLWLGLLCFWILKGQIQLQQDLRLVLFPSLILLMVWTEGHHIAKKKEMDKMKAKDLNWIFLLMGDGLLEKGHSLLLFYTVSILLFGL